MILIGKKQHTKRAEKINVDKLHIGGFVFKKKMYVNAVKTKFC